MPVALRIFHETQALMAITYAASFLAGHFQRHGQLTPPPDGRRYFRAFALLEPAFRRRFSADYAFADCQLFLPAVI